MKRIVSFILMILMLTHMAGSLPALAQEANPTPPPASGDDIIFPTETAEPDIIVTELLQVEDLNQTQGLDSKWTNILLLGGDSRGKESYARTDTMIILSVNYETSEIKMSSLMRDIWVNLDGVGGAKLNAANVYGGPKMVMRTINENFGLNISKYAMINLTALAEVIDKLGGVKVDISHDEMRYINKYMQSFVVKSLDTAKLSEYGEDTLLTGNQAMAFTRNRYQDNDYNRTERNRRLFAAIAKKLQNVGDLSAVLDVTNSLLSYVDTNIDLATLLKLGAVGLKADLSDIAQFRIPADNTFESGMKDGTWSIRLDFEQNTQLLYDFIYGSAQ